MKIGNVEIENSLALGPMAVLQNNTLYKPDNTLPSPL